MTDEEIEALLKRWFEYNDPKAREERRKEDERRWRRERAIMGLKKLAELAKQRGTSVGEEYAKLGKKKRKRSKHAARK